VADFVEVAVQHGDSVVRLQREVAVVLATVDAVYDQLGVLDWIAYHAIDLIIKY